MKIHDLQASLTTLVWLTFGGNARWELFGSQWGELTHFLSAVVSQVAQPCALVQAVAWHVLTLYVDSPSAIASLGGWFERLVPVLGMIDWACALHITSVLRMALL